MLFGVLWWLGRIVLALSLRLGLVPGSVTKPAEE